mgnify:CR=1 FL=1
MALSWLFVRGPTFSPKYFDRKLSSYYSFTAQLTISLNWMYYLGLMYYWLGFIDRQVNMRLSAYFDLPLRKGECLHRVSISSICSC